MIKFYVISSCGLKSTMQQSADFLLVISASQAQIQRSSGVNGRGCIFKKDVVN